MSVRNPSREPESSRSVREALVGVSVAGRYVLRGLVGHGGMGAVYEAEHLGLGKRVAIKFVDPEYATDERVVSRFAREARVLSKLESAHVVTVFDVGTHEGRPYLVMELLRGEDLGQQLRRERRIPLADALHLVAQVLKGLACAHTAGIVHRDLKPDNVFVVKSNTDPSFAKIVDFGVSKIERPRDATSPLALTGRGTVLGTPFYMCPEQAQAMSDVDARADLYSVGAILFECLSGRPPHTGETYEQIILSICMSDAPDLRAIEPNVPVAVAAFVARALARDRTQRFLSAERMLAALHEIAPAERTRVPLEIVPVTLPSAGPGLPEPPPVPSPLPSPCVEASRVAPGVSARTFVGMAFVATLLGIGVVMAIVGILDKPRGPAIPATASSPSPVVASNRAPETPPTGFATPSSSSASATSSSAIATSSPTTSSTDLPGASATVKPPVLTRPTAASSKVKPLDIARDLP